MRLKHNIFLGKCYAPFVLIKSKSTFLWNLSEKYFSHSDFCKLPHSRKKYSEIRRNRLFLVFSSFARRLFARYNPHNIGREINAIIHSAANETYISGLYCSHDSERNLTLSVVKCHKDRRYARNTRYIHLGTTYERGGQRHASHGDYTYTQTHTHTLCMYTFLDAHALCVGEMAWTNEAATRQVLSILPDTRSPRQNRSGCRAYVTRSRYFAPRNESAPSLVPSALPILPGRIYREREKFAGVIYRRVPRCRRFHAVSFRADSVTLRRTFAQRTFPHSSLFVDFSPLLFVTEWHRLVEFAPYLPPRHERQRANYLR